jgi:hypothetical protein
MTMSSAPWPSFSTRRSVRGASGRHQPRSCSSRPWLALCAGYIRTVARCAVRETAVVEAPCSPCASACPRCGPPQRHNHRDFWQVWRGRCAVAGRWRDASALLVGRVSQNGWLLNRRGRSLPANASGFDTHRVSISSRSDCSSRRPGEGRRRSGLRVRCAHPRAALRAEVRLSVRAGACASCCCVSTESPCLLSHAWRFSRQRRLRALLSRC